MNIVQLQEALKDFSDDQLVREMQMPSGQAPQYLVLTELERREKSRQRYQQQQQPQQSVAEETLMTRMQGGIAPMAPPGMPGMPQPMPQPMPQQSANAPSPMAPPMQQPMQMAQGGVVKAQQGMYIPQDPTLRALMMQESGGDPRARGAAGEIGAFQIMPTTAISPGYGIASMFPDLEQAVARGEYPSFQAAYLANKDMVDQALFDPQRSEQFAKSYLDVARSRFPEDEPRAIASYNVGIRGAEKLEDPSSFPYVQGVGSFAESPDETRQAPKIPLIASAEASTGDASDTPILDALGVPESSPLRTGVMPERTADSTPSFRESAQAVQEMREREAEEPPLTITQAPIKRGGLPSASGSNPAAQALKEAKAMRFLARESFASGQKPPEVVEAEAKAQAAQQEKAQQEEAEIYAGSQPETVETDEPKTQMQMLMDVLQQNRAMAEEQAEMDKYLALAQAGAQLAGSTQPTFLGALGEATQAGIGALQGSREGLRDAASDELDVMKALAVAEASGESKGAATQRDFMNKAIEYDKMIARIQSDMIGEGTPDQKALLQQYMAERDRFRILGGLPAISPVGGVSGPANLAGVIEQKRAQAKGNQ